jgi:type IV pilus assembly protein PilY1
LEAYQLNPDGTLPVDSNGDPLVSNSLWGTKLDKDLPVPKDVALGAGDKLIASDFSLTSRKVYTYLGNSSNLTDSSNAFTRDNPLITPTLLGLSSEEEKINLIQFVRGHDAFDSDGDNNKNEKRDWVLGDIFHSNAVIVGAPSRFFEEDCFNRCSDGSQSFYDAKKSREKIILIGANDGMLHAFNAKTGSEEWAFIPNSLLKNLKSMLSAHTYYVDSSPKVADVWFGDENGNGKKDAGEWKTVLVCGLRKGGKQYFALDITDTLNPIYLWEFPKPTDLVTLAKVGQSWSEPAIGRVKTKEGNELRERWVAFIGGGFDPTRTSGKVFFVVDIKTGDVMKEFYGPGMDHSLAAPPTAVDINGDGYVDRVYVGDLGGQMWVFDVSSDNVLNWAGRRLFLSPGAPVEKHPIYYQPAVAFDKQRMPWVYFGTGDRENPTEKTTHERFYAVKDDGTGPYPRTEENLRDVTTYTDRTFVIPQDPLKGWYIKLAKPSEKVLAKPTVFSNLVYFTTYTYTSTDPCKAAGEATLYVLEYLSGGGALVLDDYLQGIPSAHSQAIGTGNEGMPSAPVISVNLKGKATLTIGTTSGKILSKGVLSPVTNKEILYWREVIP